METKNKIERHINPVKRLIAACLISSLIFSGCKKGSPDDDPGLPEPPKPPETELNTPGSPAVVKEGDFSIAVLPDTQYYTAVKNGGTMDMFTAQIDWIKANQVKENIAYVAHVGDITDHGDDPRTAFNEWYPARTAMYGLENPVSIPYGLAVGNHDQFPSQYPLTGTTTYYNRYFGVKHFEGRPYYGGHYSNNNDSHYDLFTAGGIDFIVIYIEYDAFNEDQTNMNNWAYDLLGVYSSRKAIVVSHYLIGNNGTAGTNQGTQGAWRSQGQTMYNRLKSRPNLFMMLCGHVGDNGEGYREEVFEGRTVRIFLSDYQSRPNGGEGIMRLYTISPSKNQIGVRTFSPFTNTSETDGDSQFTVPLFD